MTRAVFLAHTGDPFLLNVWLKCFNVWKDEIDTLYIMRNSSTPPDVNSYIEELCSKFPQIKLYTEPNKIDHGPAITKLLKVCTEDLIGLIEEDAFVFKSGQINKCFELIEKDITDIVGSPRGSCGKEIIEAATKKWGTDDHGPNFWPNFFFCKKSDLLKTDLNFAGKAWYKGDLIPQLDLTIKDDVCYADTFVWASIQLRGFGLRVRKVEQYHSIIEDLSNFTQVKGIFDRRCPWVHIGSLSGWQEVLFNNSVRNGEIEEWERRVAMYLLFLKYSDPKKIITFRDQYESGIKRVMESFTLKESRVEYRKELMEKLLEL